MPLPEETSHRTKFSVSSRKASTNNLFQHAKEYWDSAGAFARYEVKWLWREKEGKESMEADL
jgi:hypothetical protein